jgi:hypothetical protein
MKSGALHNHVAISPISSNRGTKDKVFWHVREAGDESHLASGTTALFDADGGSRGCFDGQAGVSAGTIILDSLSSLILVIQLCCSKRYSIVVKIRYHCC